MSLGIGLGAFAGGFKQGYGMGKQIKADMNERKTQKEITNAYESAQKNFQEGVAAGQLDPNTWDKFANEHFYPQIVSVHEKAGDFKTAQALREHLKTQQAIEHGRTFANGLYQYNMGNYHGLANTANQIMKHNGLEGYHAKFLDNGLYRITMPGPDGKESVQDMSPEKFFSIYYDPKLNPEAAALYHISQRNKNTAKAPGIAGGWGSEADDKPTMNFDAAFKQARELAPPDASLDEIKDMAYKIQEASRPSSYQRSTTGITGEKTLIDTRTGRPVGTPAAGQGGNTDSNGASAQQPTLGGVPLDDLISGSRPTNRDGLVGWAAQAKKSGLSDAAIAYGWNAATIANKGELPEEFRAAASDNLTKEEMMQVEASLGLTEEGRNVADNQTEQRNTGAGKQIAIQKIEQAFNQGEVNREGLYQLMEKEGLGIEDLPKGMRRIMREAAPGLWGRTKQTFGLPAYDGKDKNILKDSLESIMKRHDRTEYRDQNKKRQHEKEKSLLQQVKAGKLSASDAMYHLNKSLPVSSNPSKDFLDAINLMKEGKNGSANHNDMPGIERKGNANVPIPRQKPRVVKRQDGWLYDEKGHPIGQNPNHPNPSPVPDL